MKNIIFLLLITSFTNAQTNNPLEYFPHETGDMWEYFLWDGPHYMDTLQIITIHDSVDIENNIYITQLSRAINPIGPSNFFEDTMRYKIDTLYQVWGRVHELFNVIAFKLNAKKGDKWILRDDGFSHYEMAKVMNIEDRIFWGQSYLCIDMRYYYTVDPNDTINNLVRYEGMLAKGLGLTWQGGGESVGSAFLIGAVIDGQVYGDTTQIVLSIKEDSEFAFDFAVSSNFPNPFNSSTHINLVLNQDSNISLEILNITGQVIKSIIKSTNFKASNYSFIWKPAVDVTSGVYFLRLLVDHKKQITKSMIYLK